MNEHKLRAIMMYLANHRGYVTANQVAAALDISWNTAKDYLEDLCRRGAVLRAGDKTRTLYAIRR